MWIFCSIDRAVRFGLRTFSSWFCDRRKLLQHQRLQHFVDESWRIRLQAFSALWIFKIRILDHVTIGDM